MQSVLFKVFFFTFFLFCEKRTKRFFLKKEVFLLSGGFLAKRRFFQKGKFSSKKGFLSKCVVFFKKVSFLF